MTCSPRCNIRTSSDSATKQLQVQDIIFDGGTNYKFPQMHPNATLDGPPESRHLKALLKSYLLASKPTNKAFKVGKLIMHLFFHFGRQVLQALANLFSQVSCQMPRIGQAAEDLLQLLELQLPGSLMKLQPCSCCLAKAMMNEAAGGEIAQK